jgi:biopolymer transport protein ExbD
MRRSSRHRSGNTGHTDLNVIPLIDVVFFLLVYYVISTSFSAELSVPIDRPASGQAQTVSGAFVPVALTREGSVQVGDAVLGDDHVASAVREALDRSGSERVVLMADRETPTHRLLRVMDLCRSGGASAVDVAAVREE